MTTAELERAAADAFAYAERHKLWAAALRHEGGQATLGPHAGEPHAIYSGTKSFWGIAALIARERSWLQLDEPVASELVEFRGDDRAGITVRDTLRMTAGYGFGGLGNAVPTFERALEVPLKAAPGSAFTYGGIPLQVFGAFFTRRLARHNVTPHALLAEAILAPAGVEVARWRELKDGTRTFPTGAFLNIEHWLRYGAWVLENRSRFADAFQPAVPNPSYGLGWWLTLTGIRETVWYASGSGGQGLYLLPERDIVAAHFGDGDSYKHEAFVKRLLAALP